MSKEKIIIKFIKNTKLSKTPKKGTYSSAGYDLYSDIDIEINPNESKVISTGICLEIPNGYYGRIADRSSYAKKNLRIGGGVIDSDYRGPIGIIMFNHSNDVLKILCGDKVAQIIIEKCPEVIYIEENVLTETVRGSMGFGSTGNFDDN